MLTSISMTVVAVSAMTVVAVSAMTVVAVSAMTVVVVIAFVAEWSLHSSPVQALRVYKL